MKRAPLAVVLVGLLHASVANAFCRMTACDETKKDCAPDERGCPREGAVVNWRKSPIPYRFHAAGSAQVERDDEARNAVRAAFNRWSDVACKTGRTSLRFEELEDANGPLDGDPEPYTIYFRDGEWPYKARHNDLALTTLSWGEETGRVRKAILEINTANMAFGTRDDFAAGYDLEAVVTHEAGHYIGLAHSSEPDSIMVDTYCQSDERCSAGKVEARRLSPDDERAVCTLYPPEGQSGYRAETPDATLAPTCTARPGTTSGGGLFAVLVLAGRWRRRRL